MQASRGPSNANLRGLLPATRPSRLPLARSARIALSRCVSLKPPDRVHETSVVAPSSFTPSFGISPTPTISVENLRARAQPRRLHARRGSVRGSIKGRSVGPAARPFAPEPPSFFGCRQLLPLRQHRSTGQVRVGMPSFVHHVSRPSVVQSSSPRMQCRRKYSGLHIIYAVPSTAPPMQTAIAHRPPPPSCTAPSPCAQSHRACPP